MSTAQEIIEIPLSHTKLVLTLLGSIAFVGAGIWITGLESSRYPKEVHFFIGVISTLFFGITGIASAIKLTGGRIGLRISNRGIWLNTSATSIGWIDWQDIDEIKVKQIRSQKFLMLLVSNPETYINAQKNYLARLIMKLNYKRYGSPLFVSAHTLKMSFHDLVELIDRNMNA